jgi:hypothetical protein
MQLALTAHLPFRLARPAPRPVRAEAPASPAVPPSPTQLARRAGAPQDNAFYSCGCGYAFTAAVSTTVGCPHCGTSQAW